MPWLQLALLSMVVFPAQPMKLLMPFWPAILPTIQLFTATIMDMDTGMVKATPVVITAATNKTYFFTQTSHIENTNGSLKTVYLKR